MLALRIYPCDRPQLGLLIGKTDGHLFLKHDVDRILWFRSATAYCKRVLLKGVLDSIKNPCNRFT